jgi:tetratricopeptide (TPR) repeat protein
MSDTLPFDPSVDDLAEEFARRWRDGERPTVEEYTARYPHLAAEIRDVFPAVLLMEQLKPRRAGPAPPAAVPTEASPAPERLGDYRIVREIGRGGMGVVYEAEQEALGRRVALKVLPAQLFPNEKLRARFRREAQAAARLHHTNIVPVFGSGEQDGCCFYVMQLIEGRSLEAAPAEPVPAPPDAHRAVARLGVQVAEALAYAHGQGVLHRDIKPSNLLLDGHGTVWVTDFGVAKLVEEAHLTQSGELVGTLRYMPPERFLGRSDARGDVYSLGITLYELLARHPAFPDTTPHHLIQLISNAEPPALRRQDATIPADLETVVLKAAARDPAHRYQSAAELADDLRRFLDDRPVRARRVGPVEQAWRWCRRNRAVAGSVAAAFALLLIAAAVSVAAYLRTAAANREAAAANGRMHDALVSEQAQREHAEQTSAAALAAMNRIYDRFAPSRIVVTPALSAESTSDEEGIDLPPPPVLSPEAVRLSEELLGFYERLAQEGGGYPQLEAEAAEANQRIGDIRQRLGQFEPALTAYRKAVELYGRLEANEPDATVRIRLARTYNDLGHCLQALQRTDEARDAHTRALATLTEAPKELASRPEYRFELARTYYLEALRGGPLGPPGPGPGRGPGRGGFGRGGPPGPGRGDPRASHKAVALLEQLVQEHPAVPEYRHLLACCYRDRPPDRAAGEPPGGGIARSLDLLRQLVKDFPKVPDYRHDLCETLARVRSPGPPGNPRAAADARPLLEEAVVLADGLGAEYPNVPQYAATRAQVHERLGVAIERIDPDRAEKALRKAVALQTGLVRQHPEVVAYPFVLAMMQSSLARFLGGRGAWGEARTLLEASTDRLEELVRKEPRLGFARGALGRGYRDLAQALRQLGDRDGAAAVLRKAEALGPGRGPEPFGPRGRRGDR